MSALPRIPSFRSLDIYRLAVIRRLKKQDVAASFGVTPSRISQVLRRVKSWVNESVGDWLFPRRHELRFLAALAVEKIRILESDDHPENVLIEGHGWSYTRSIPAADLANPSPEAPLNPEPRAPNPLQTPQLDAPASGPVDASPGGHVGPNVAPHFTPHPVNSLEQGAADSSALTDGMPTDLASPATLDLANRLAQLLTLWEKSKKLTPRKAAKGTAAKRWSSLGPSI